MSHAENARMLAATAEQLLDDYVDLSHADRRQGFDPKEAHAAQVAAAFATLSIAYSSLPAGGQPS